MNPTTASVRMSQAVQAQLEAYGEKLSEIPAELLDPLADILGAFSADLRSEARRRERQDEGWYYGIQDGISKIDYVGPHPDRDAAREAAAVAIAGAPSRFLIVTMWGYRTPDGELRLYSRERP